MLPKRAKRPAAKEGNPLAARAQELARQEAALAAARQKLERQIEIAPLLKKQRDQARREEFIKRASRGRTAMPPTSLPDRRFPGYEATIATQGHRHRLRSERRQGRLTFFFLLFVLGLVLLYLYWTILRG
jgi:hypothetical protein